MTEMTASRITTMTGSLWPDRARGISRRPKPSCEPTSTSRFLAPAARGHLATPAEAVIRSRLMEPGEMASPQRPVFSLAVIDPKWVCAYVAEADLGKLRMGLPASIVIGSFPDQS